MPKQLRARPSETPSAVEVLTPRTTSRHQFSAGDRQLILTAAAACPRGELGALLRREGIYHSQLQTWGAQLAASFQSPATTAPGAGAQTRRHGS